jgi:hypothetical protein
MSNLVLKQVISWLLQALIGSVNWALVRETVASYADNPLGGYEKRQLVADLVQSTLIGVSTRLMNFAIEAAVIHLKGVGR